MRILADKMAIKSSQQAFKDAVSTVATEEILTRIGFQGGYHDARVYWVASAGLWAYFGLPPDEKSPGRYWNAFGLSKPGTAVSITCEINPPVHGTYRRTAGAFGRSGAELYLLHRGHFTAGGAIPKAFTRDYFDGKWISVDDGDRCSDLLRVGRLPDPSFVYDLRDFVKAVMKLKEIYKKTRKS